MIKEDLTGQKFGHWTVLQELGYSKVLCQCDCENKTIRELYKKAIKSGQSKSCGCAAKNNFIFTLGKKYNHWTVIKELGGGKILCQCDCPEHTVRELYKKAVLNGQSKSCGCARAENCKKTKQETGSLESKYIGQQFGEWTVIKRIENSEKVLCRCSCENATEKEVYIQHLLDGSSRSCGCKKLEHSRETKLNRFGDISSKKANNPRQQWQIEVVQSKENFEKYLNSLGEKKTLEYLTNALNLTQPSLSRIINGFGLNDYINYISGSSYLEEELYQYIKQLYNGVIETHNSKVLENEMELDIYLPEIKTAFEFNGNYWHSSLQKHPNYHQIKTLKCFNKDIRLVHIFEYEWVTNNDNIKRFIKDIVHNCNVLYARDLRVEEVEESKEVKDFLNTNHLQGYAQSEVNIRLTNNNDTIAMMTFGKPRFNNKYQYELIRLAFKSGYKVIGGTAKMLKYFINNYNPDSIISYCDISKFSGKTYTKLGFKPLEVTKPSYVWCKSHTNNILTRYQTQKHKLVENGLGIEDQTEDGIMESLDYYKIYNSGNAVFIWTK